MQVFQLSLQNVIILTPNASGLVDTHERECSWSIYISFRVIDRA